MWLLIIHGSRLVSHFCKVGAWVNESSYGISEHPLPEWISSGLHKEEELDVAQITELLAIKYQTFSLERASFIARRASIHSLYKLQRSFIQDVSIPPCLPAHRCRHLPMCSDQAIRGCLRSTRGCLSRSSGHNHVPSFQLSLDCTQMD